MRDADLDGIPQSISRARRDELLGSLGLVTLDHIRSVTFHWTSIEVEVIATDAGGDYLVENNEMKVHTIIIPLVAESKQVQDVGPGADLQAEWDRVDRSAETPKVAGDV